MSRPSNQDLLRLAAKYLLHVLYTNQHDMSKLTHSAEFCNLWSLCQEGLGEHDDYPQVPLEDIIVLVEQELLKPCRPKTKK